MTINVMFVISNLAHGGAEAQLIKLVNNLDSNLFKKHLFVCSSELDQLTKVDTIQVSHNCVARRSKFDIGPARELAELIDRHEIDVVHCTLQFALLISWIALRFSTRRPKIVLALHSMVFIDRKGMIFDLLLYQWLMRKCERVIFVCEAQRDDWIRKFPFLSKLNAVVHNGIEIEHFNPTAARCEGFKLRKALGIDERATVIAHVAVFRPEKGHLVLLKAFAKVVQKLPTAVLVFAGDGPLKNVAEQLVKDLKLLRNVIFLGKIQDIKPVFGAAHFSILPSTSETFSIAMLESLALEVPMIASDVGGAREAILHERTGLIVPISNIDEMAKAMTKLIANSSTREQMGKEGRALAAQLYSCDMMVEKTSQLLQEVVTLSNSVSRVDLENDSEKMR